MRSWPGGRDPVCGARKWPRHARINSPLTGLRCSCGWLVRVARGAWLGRACLLLLQVLLRQVLEVTLGEGDVRCDRHLRLVPRHCYHVTKVAGLARHLDAVLQKLLLRGDGVRRGGRWPVEQALDYGQSVCLACARCRSRGGQRTKDAASMMPSSTGCEQSTVNFSVCLRFTSFFAFLIACARKGPRDLWRASGAEVACGLAHHGEAGSLSVCDEAGGRIRSENRAFSIWHFASVK